MPSDVSVIVADASRLGAIREGVTLPGRIMPFTSGNVASAMATIRAYRPKVVAIDAVFGETPAGAAFAERIDEIAIAGSTIVFIVADGSRWVTMPRGLGVLRGSRNAFANVVQPAVMAPLQEALAAVSTALPLGSTAGSNTRRAPRFLTRAPLNVALESGEASLVDISILGAQIVSLPVLRPRQKIKLALPDPHETLNVVAEVAWSMFERPRLQLEPHYRVGLEFAGAAQEVLEDYRRRHCLDQPVRLRVS